MNQNSQNGLAWVFLATAVALFVIFLTVKLHNSRLLAPEIAPDSVPGTTRDQAKPPTTEQTSATSSLADQTDLIEGLNNTYNVFGTTKPQVTIVEFGDFSCPHCQASFLAIRAISLKYQDQVRFIWRDRTPNTRALGLALTAHCAGEQNKFWEMHDLLFANQSDSLGETPDDPKLQTLIKKTGVNLNDFTLCLKSNRGLTKIKKSVADSERLGVRGTPTWFINGVKFEGEIAKTQLENYLQGLLNVNQPL